MWKKFVGPDRPQTKIRRTRIVCWIPYATNTHSEYVIIMNFPLQQRLHKHASLLHYTYIAYLVKCYAKFKKSLLWDIP
jgi:hypothetical protein